MKELAPKLRAVALSGSPVVKRASDKRFTHWPPHEVSTNEGKHSSAWLGALTGAGTAPASIAYGLDANGHLIGAQFGGPNTEGNISPMQGKVNSPTFSLFENTLKNEMVQANIRVRMQVEAQGDYRGRDQEWRDYTNRPKTEAKIQKLRGSLDRKEPPNVTEYLENRPKRYRDQVTGFQEVFDAGARPHFEEVAGQAPLSRFMGNPIREEDVATDQMSSFAAKVASELRKLREEQDRG